MKIPPITPFFLLVAALGLALPVVVSCADDGIGGRSKGKGKTRNGGQDDGDEGGLADGGNTSGRYTKTIDNSGANFQVKDVKLLKSSLVSCMGDAAMMTVTPDMIKGTTETTLPDGKFSFLLPGTLQPGSNVVDALRSSLVDLERSSRTSTAADALTPGYLQALETVGNVVAHNCTIGKPECTCEEKELARAMLTRCLPSLDPETKEMDAAAGLLASVCAEGPEGMRRAVASMIASYAFAAAR